MSDVLSTQCARDIFTSGGGLHRFDFWSNPSALNQTDGTGQRSSLARIASADLVQTNGLGLALCSTTKALMPACRSAIERKTPRRWLIPLSQVNQNLVLVGQIRNGPGFEFFGRSWSVC